MPVLWLLATYPGITYWSGLRTLTSPSCREQLDRLSRSEAWADVLRAALLMGVVFLAYDFLPFFGAAAILLLFVQKRWRPIIPALAGLLIPTMAVALMFAMMQVPLANSNTGTSLTVIAAYLNPASYGTEWLVLLARLPVVLLSNFIYSNMIPAAARGTGFWGADVARS